MVDFSGFDMTGKNQSGSEIWDCWALVVPQNFEGKGNDSMQCIPQFPNLGLSQGSQQSCMPIVCSVEIMSLMSVTVFSCFL